MADPVLDEMYVVYPQGKAAVEAYERIAIDGEQVIVDNEYCSMIVTGFDEDTYEECVNETFEIVPWN